MGHRQITTLIDLETAGRITAGSEAGLWIPDFGPRTGEELDEVTLKTYTEEHLLK